MNSTNFHLSLLSTLFCLLIFSGCKDLFSKSGNVDIRVKNNSSYLMQNIKVNFSGEEVIYGDLSASEESGYKSVSEAYRYAYVETVIEDKKVVLQPIDYVGEKLLEPGDYTYVLDVVEDSFQSENYTYSLILELKNN